MSNPQFETPDQSRALALLAHREPRKFDMSIAGKGWSGITDEERDWSEKAFLKRYGRPIEHTLP